MPLRNCRRILWVGLTFARDAAHVGLCLSFLAVSEADQKATAGQSGGNATSWIDHDNRAEHTRSSNASSILYPPPPAAAMSPLIDAHMRHIQQFLQAHMDNVHALQKSLGQPHVTVIAPKNSVKQRGAITGTSFAGEWDALSQHFSLSVLAVSLH